jgi:hypothetical protein
VSGPSTERRYECLYRPDGVAGADGAALYLSPLLFNMIFHAATRRPPRFFWSARVTVLE